MSVEIVKANLSDVDHQRAVVAMMDAISMLPPPQRGNGIGKRLLLAIEQEAKRTGCCKLTLEVQTNNPIAHAVYEKFGFRQAVYAADANGGGPQYMVKQLI